MKNKVIFYLMIAVFGFSQISCGTSNRTKGAIIGAASGGAAGALLSKDNKAISILVGAALGGTAGALIGAYMDKQAEDLEESLEGAEIIRKDEGIYIVFDSGLLFDYDSYELRSETKSNLLELSESLGTFKDTEINILGHTDATGSSEYNEKLSNQRANNVLNYLTQQGVDIFRLTSIGMGEIDPLTTNETAEGRQLNRRVEIIITAGEEMKKKALAGKSLE